MKYHDRILFLAIMVGCHNRMSFLGVTVLRYTFLDINNTQMALYYLGSILIRGEKNEKKNAILIN